MCTTGLLRAQISAPAGSQPAISLAPQDIVDSNTLTKDGNRPFHLKLTYQIFDLKGDTPETGTQDYWWAGPQGTYLEATSPSLGTVHKLYGSGTTTAAA